jgi:hypothetical protein
MRPQFVLIVLGFLLFTASALGTTKLHTVSFGKWTSIKWCVGPNEGKCLDLKTRTLFVDSWAKQFTLGSSHDITDRLFVVCRAFRVNDSLPGEPAVPSRWLWQRGGWLPVDRMTGHISAIALPEFDSYYSVASWVPRLCRL